MRIYNPPVWLKDKQERALACARTAGLPLKNDEGWRYTSLAGFAKINFAEAKTEGFQFLPSVKQQAIAAAADHVLYFYNGTLVSAASQSAQTEDLYVLPLSRVLMSSGGINEKARVLLERGPNENLKAIGWLNFARFQDGAFVYLRSAASRTVRVAIFHVYGENAGESQPHAVFPRNLYVFGPETKAEIVELHVGPHAQEFHATSASDFILEARAQVQALQVFSPGEKAYFFSDTYSEVHAAAEMKLTQIAKGGRLVRNELLLRLKEEDARADVLGLAMADGHQHLDTSTYIRHEKGATHSDQLMKAVVDGSGRAVFAGRLLIEEKAQKAAAKQQCHNLILSDTAEADARPQLEVRADDVKAAHGATVGQIRAEELFYLQSRGLDKVEAMAFLTRAFHMDVLERIESDFLRQAAVSSLEAK